MGGKSSSSKKTETKQTQNITTTTKNISAGDVQAGATSIFADGSVTLTDPGALDLATAALEAVINQNNEILAGASELVADNNTKITDFAREVAQPDAGNLNKIIELAGYGALGYAALKILRA